MRRRVTPIIRSPSSWNLETSRKRDAARARRRIMGVPGVSLGFPARFRSSHLKASPAVTLINRPHVQNELGLWPRQIDDLRKDFTTDFQWTSGEEKLIS